MTACKQSSFLFVLISRLDTILTIVWTKVKQGCFFSWLHNCLEQFYHMTAIYTYVIKAFTLLYRNICHLSKSEKKHITTWKTTIFIKIICICPRVCCFWPFFGRTVDVNCHLVRICLDAVRQFVHFYWNDWYVMPDISAMEKVISLHLMWSNLIMI